MRRLRQGLAWLLVLVAVAAAVPAALGVWLRRELLDSDRVAQSVRTAVSAPAVRERLVDEITGQVTASLPPEAGPALPAIRREVDALVTGDEFGDAFEGAVRSLHAALVSESPRRRLVLDLSPMGPLVADAVARADPRLGGFVDTGGLAAVELGDAGDELPDLSGLRGRLDGAVVGAGGVAAAALVAAVALASRRTSILRGAGLLAAVVAVGIAGLTFPASGLLLDAVDQEAVREIAERFVGQVTASLRAGALAAVAAGVLVAVATAWWERRPATALMS